MKHTKGPWSVVNHSWAETSIYDQADSRVALLSIYDEATEETQYEMEHVMDGNARLIAAAPDLLDAALRIRQECEAIPVPGLTDFILDVLDEPIKKATGLTPE